MDTLKHKQALLIKCEGEVTEPLFFDGFRERLSGFVYTISPEPRYVEADLEPRPTRGGKRRKKRQLKGEPIDDGRESYPMPLNWVMDGIEKLDTYENVWCVFDKDGHPAMKEAFDKVHECQGLGQKINIAFSSRCIEYYFLLHFEYIYKAFLKCECGKKDSNRKRTVYFRCMTPEAVPGEACNGDKCINGYARSKGYWQESKQEDKAIFPLIKDKIWIGIRNSILLRRESYAKDIATPIYLRNPFVTVDHLVASLLGYEVLEEYGDLDVIKDSGTRLSIHRTEIVLTIKNVGDIAYSIQSNLMSSVDVNTGSIKDYTPKNHILQPEETESYEMNGEDGSLFVLSLGTKKFIIAKG